ncbi:hypothetical protein SAMN05444412_11632 [Rhodonellum ikkaensis]|uniref:Uncharacterized protein n=1 Tax=Rhodonellum ikkaensis TaxID=336829 RepID=A0A1H3TBB1_9BACT|nr:hypothetical protein SAMN05444412_11632 [Rhodonellum ikkaensis]
MLLTVLVKFFLIGFSENWTGFILEDLNSGFYF